MFTSLRNARRERRDALRHSTDARPEMWLGAGKSSSASDDLLERGRRRRRSIPPFMHLYP
jgi:hypothetical protein